MIREFLNSKLVERKTFATQLDSIEEQVKDILNQMSRLEAKDTQINEWLKTTKTEIIESEKEISELEKKNLVRSQNLEEKVDQLSHVRDDLEKLITQMSDREEEVKKLDQQINSTEKKLVEKDLKIKLNHAFLLICNEEQIKQCSINVRIMDDKEMQEAFQKGEDIHASTAAKVFNVALEEVSREQRSQAKTVNFGIVYGVSAFGLSNQTNLNRKESKALIDAYYETYPQLKSYIRKQVDFARENGYVETILGRRRYLRDINSQNSIVRSAAERNAVNAPIQGSAADIIKIAMLRIHEKLKDYDSQMLLQVHDELVFDAKKSELDALTNMIKTEMEQAYKLQVPLVVDVGTGTNWLEAH